MRVTRVVFGIVVLANVGLNGLALAKRTWNFEFLPDILTQTLIFNLILLPIGLYSAYRLGEIAEEQYQIEERSKAKRSAEQACAPGDDEVSVSKNTKA